MYAYIHSLLQKSIFLLFYDLVYRNEYFVKILFAPRIEEYPDAPINIHLSIIPEDSPLMQASTGKYLLIFYLK